MFLTQRLVSARLNFNGNILVIRTDYMDKQSNNLVICVKITQSDCKEMQLALNQQLCFVWYLKMMIKHFKTVERFHCTE